jgi:hypothetical protein
MKGLENQCHATPDEVEELYKRSYTNLLMLDKIPQFNLKGDKLTKKFTVCISPSRTKIGGICAFKDSEGKCKLISEGINLSGCDLNTEKITVTFKKRSIDWLADKGAACIKFFSQMILP